MARFSSFTAATALLFTASPAALHAQDPAAAQRVCRVLLLGERGSAPETIQLYDGKKTQPIELPRMNLSPVYKVPGGAVTLTLLNAALPEKQGPPAGSPSVSVPETMESFYLLVTADPANKVIPLRLQVIDASSTGFHAGQMMWYNLTPTDVMGTTAGKPVNVKARSKAITDAPIATDDDYNVVLNYRAPSNPKPQPICETRWTHDPRSRTLVFLMNEAGAKAPHVLAVRDIPPAKTEDHH